MERRGIDDFGEFVVIANASVVVRAVCRVAGDDLKGRIGGTGNADLVESVPAGQERVLSSSERIDCLARVGEACRAQSYRGQDQVSLEPSPPAEKDELTAVAPRSLTGYTPVTSKMLFEHYRLGTGLLESDLVNALRFAHLAIPCFDIGADQIEDPLEWWDHHALDVVGGVETEAADGEEKALSASFRDGGRARVAYGSARNSSGEMARWTCGWPGSAWNIK